MQFLSFYTLYLLELSAIFIFVFYREWPLKLEKIIVTSIIDIFIKQKVDANESVSGSM